jgi:DNA-binding HxlR family transcriptional regulator
VRARKKTLPENAECPIRMVLDRVGDRWSLLILRALGQHTCLRFTELGRQIPDVSPRVLAQTLRRLEQDGYVSRTVYPVVPPRVDYELTALGRSLLGTVLPLITWAKANMKAVSVARKRYTPPAAKVAL